MTPVTNPRLRTAVEKAKSVNMPADNIKRAIQKGTGELEGASYEEMVLEGYGPGGVAILVEGTTDNRNRTVSEIRHIFTKNGGNLGTAGSVSYMFKPRGYIAVATSKIDEEKLMDLALEAGADDIQTSGDLHEIYTAPNAHDAVVQALKKAGDRAGRGGDRQVRREQHHARGPQGAADAEAHGDPRRPGRRAERLGQLRRLREGAGSRRQLTSPWARARPQSTPAPQ